MLIDIIAGLLIALGFYLGYQRGLIKTLFDTFSIFIGVIAALKLSPIVVDVIDSSTNINPAISLVLGIVLTFLLVMVLIRFVGSKLESVLKAVNLNFLNKFNGGVLQALFFAILLSFGLALTDKVQLVKEETKAQSMSYPYLAKMPAMSEKMLANLRPIFQDFWDTTMSTMDRLKQKAEGQSTDSSKG